MKPSQSWAIQFISHPTQRHLISISITEWNPLFNPLPHMSHSISSNNEPEFLAAGGRSEALITRLTPLSTLFGLLSLRLDPDVLRQEVGFSVRRDVLTRLVVLLVNEETPHLVGHVRVDGGRTAVLRFVVAGFGAEREVVIAEAQVWELSLNAFRVGNRSRGGSVGLWRIERCVVVLIAEALAW